MLVYMCIETDFFYVSLCSNVYVSTFKGVCEFALCARASVCLCGCGCGRMRVYL